MSLGENVRRLREGQGLTLDQVAERSGVEVGTINALENRKSTRSKFAPQLAKAFGVSLEALMGDSLGGFSPATPEQVKSDSVFPLAHGVSQPSAIVEVPHLTWNELMTGKKPLPPIFEVTLTDDAMAPDFPEGTVITFSTLEGEPRALDCVLVQDGDGQVFFREYRIKKPGVWHAAALNHGYEPLDAAAERLTVLGIMIKNTKVGRRSAWGK